MTASERVVAGMKCSEVLGHLSDYIDGTLDAATRSNIEMHLRGCNWCEQFGGRFSEVVATLRRLLRDPQPLEHSVAVRLRSFLDAKR